ncbi:MAG: hypothetical protein KDA41_16255, partial [Planctomycetales bacterium]|nr:hypothetical protein [Planctomycetales bacterium]
MNTADANQQTPAVWRVAAAAALVVTLVLLGPLFVCEPPWSDATHWDVIAQELLKGKLLYRDVMETNLPGAALVHVPLRALFGYRSEVLHAFDLLVIGALAYLLPRIALGPAAHAARAFAAAAMLLFYFALAPVCHCQRDFWMMLPMTLALWLRSNQLRADDRSWPRLVGLALLEGLCWGLAVWIKPFSIIPAAAEWLVGLLWTLRTRSASYARAAGDTAGLIAGGLAAGAIGFAWLYASGTAPYFWDVMLHWSGEYRAIATWPRRLG